MTDFAPPAPPSPDPGQEARALPARIGMRIIDRPYRWAKRPWPDDRIAQVALTIVSLVITTFVIMNVLHFNPLNPGRDVIFDDVTPTGGDLGAHVWGPAYLRDHLLPDFQLTGWSMDWYGGLPVYRFYMVVPALAIVALDVLLPYGVAFKLVAISGLLSLPFCCWAFGRLARFRYPIPELFAFAGLCFALNESTTIYGGNVLSVMAGEFSFSIAISFMLLGFGLLARGLQDGTRKHLAWAAVFLALACLSHGIVLIYTAVGALVIVACRCGADLWRVLVDADRRPGDRLLLYTVLCSPAAIGLAAVVTYAADLPWIVIPAVVILALAAVAALSIRIGMDSPSNRVFVRRALYGLAAGGLTLLLAAFWIGPFVFNHDYMTDMKYGAEPSGYFDSYWPMIFDQKPFFDVVINGLAIFGLVASFVRRNVFGVAIGITGLVAVALVYLTRDSLPVIGLLWNARVLPMVYLMRYLMMMVGAVEVATLVIAAFRNRPARELPGVGTHSLIGTAGAVVVLVIFGWLYQILPLGGFFVDGDQRAYGWGPIQAPSAYDWARSSGPPIGQFGGYEKKLHYPEYYDLVHTMDTIGDEQGCGRALWEIDNTTVDGGNGKYGTTMALMLLPFWTDGCIASMEGLFFEASATTPYHFLTAAAMSRQASNPVRQLRYVNNDAAVGIDYVQALGVSYVMVTTPEAKAQAETRSELDLIEQSGPWDIYAVDDAAVVEPLDVQPVIVNGRDGDQRECFLEVGTSWFQHQDDWAAMPAAGGPDGWQRVDVEIDTAEMQPPDQRTDRCGDPEEDFNQRAVNVVNPIQDIDVVELEDVTVSNVDIGEESVEFDVSEPGVPVLVRVGYFPNWNASGADGPYRIGPNQMVVIPTDTHVTLSFERSSSDLFFDALTVVGIGLLVVVRLKGTWDFRV